MKNKLLTFAASTAILCVLGHSFAKPVLAAVAAALTKNVDEKGRNPYFQYVDCFALSTGCSADFPAVPTGYRLVVEHVNMFVQLTNTLDYVDVYGHYVNGVQFIQVGHLTLQGTDQNNRFYVENEPLLAYYEAGEQPAIEIKTASGSANPFIQASITLSGYLVNLNQ